MDAQLALANLMCKVIARSTIGKTIRERNFAVEAISRKGQEVDTVTLEAR